MDKEPLQLLILEDNPADAELLERELKRAGFKFGWSRVETEADYLQKLEEKIDIILSDYAMPQFSGLRALQLLRVRGLDIPFVLISGPIGEEVAVLAMREGAAELMLRITQAEAVGNCLSTLIIPQKQAENFGTSPLGLRENDRGEIQFPKTDGGNFPESPAIADADFDRRQNKKR